MNAAQLTTTTEAIDPVFLFIFGICLVLLLGITVAMLTFVIRYHRSRAPQPTSTVDSHLGLEFVWTALPTLLVLAMFWYGWAGYLALRNVPEGAMEVTATARQWAWNFTYANGKTSPRLYVAVGKPVRVELVSLDVIHGFYLPAFRVKRDVVPGMQNHAWFVAESPGSYDLFCSSFCGTGHSAMITTVEALPAAEFAAWLERKEAAEAPGRALLEKYGCLGCHSLDGSAGLGPSFKGIWGRKETVLSVEQERSIIVVDEAYLRRSLLEPNTDLVIGFEPIMPAFALQEEELVQILAYLKGLK